MDEKKIGRQTPTVSAVLPYTETKGAETVENAFIAKVFYHDNTKKNRINTRNS